MSTASHARKNPRTIERSPWRAAEIRARFAQQGTLVVNLISSPGSGNTTLLETTVDALRDRYQIAAIEGDDTIDMAEEEPPAKPEGQP